MKNKYLLVVDEETYTNYGDDYSTSTTLLKLNGESPVLWDLTSDEAQEYQMMFNDNYRKYSGHRFLQIRTPEELTVQTLTDDLEEYRQKQAKAQAQRDAAEKKRKETAEQRKLEKERKKLAKDEDLRKRLYEELKQEFKNA